MRPLLTDLASNSSPNANAVILRFDSNGKLFSYECTRELRSDNPAAATGTATKSGTSAATGTAIVAEPEPVARPAPPPQPARADNLPDWLPSTSTKDPPPLTHPSVEAPGVHADHAIGIAGVQVLRPDAFGSRAGSSKQRQQMFVCRMIAHRMRGLRTVVDQRRPVG